ncbi:MULTISPECIES: class I SAM-dependent methyltransferase [unclassified Mycolicibacterium]|uniref:class I SAM-dependent methyltransferase n=2 Tax=unclassified Mycolicibacterium TaxID=2636767 RepID=UPI001390CCA6|nr:MULTISPECIES: class I SAM-dependent methyltransferase [unclassified Mycolicibacterium]
MENRYRLIRCMSCRSQYFRPDPNLHVIDSDGTSEYWEQFKFELYADPTIQAAFGARYNEVLDEARGHTSPVDSILDIGCGIGNFLEHAQSVGLRAVGSDVDSTAIEHARERGLTAHVADELSTAVPDGSMDAMSLWDVVEHLFDPVAVLEQVVPKVRSGGAILIETPDGAFPVRTALLAAHRLSGGRLDRLTDPMYYWEHKIYFTERGLGALLGRVGVDLVWVRRETSLREKMDVDFAHHNDGSLVRSFLDNAWPVMEGTFRRLGRGNKLLAVGRVR